MRSKFMRNESKYFYIFVAPWIIGFIIFTLYPIIASFFYSLTRYDVINSAIFIGFRNYIDLFNDELFWRSISATLYYTLLSVPIGLILSMIFALLINQKIPAKGFFRTVMYLPSMISGVAMSLLWMWVFNPQIGMFNYILSLIGINGPLWLLDKNWAMPALIIMSFWGMGTGMVIFLAALQCVPTYLYEAAILDGTNPWHRFWHVTFPMISPVFLFQMIMGLINSFQVFTQAYVMTRGGPYYSTLFYVYYLHQNAFRNFRMGYASAMAWILLVVVMLLTYIIMQLSNRFVYYEGGNR